MDSTNSTKRLTLYSIQPSRLWQRSSARLMAGRRKTERLKTRLSAPKLTCREITALLNLKVAVSRQSLPTSLAFPSSTSKQTPAVEPSSLWMPRKTYSCIQAWKIQAVVVTTWATWAVMWRSRRGVAVRASFRRTDLTTSITPVWCLQILMEFKTTRSPCLNEQRLLIEENCKVYNKQVQNVVEVHLKSSWTFQEALRTIWAVHYLRRPCKG